MKFIDAVGNIKFGKTVFFGNNIQMSEQADGVVTINAGILSGTGSSLALLGDVVVTSIQDDQFLRYSTGSVKWVNQFITAADVGAGTFKAGTFTFPGTLIANGNLTASGTNTLIGLNRQQVGSSVTNARMPSILFSDIVGHFYSGTSEASLSSFLLKANSISSPTQKIKINGIVQTGSLGANFQVRIGNANILSGTIGSTQISVFDGYFVRTGSALISAWQFSSGQAFIGNVRSYGAATIILGTNLTSAIVDWTQDQLIDFRANNLVPDVLGVTLSYLEISYEAV